ncbi:MAG: hypothetical protein DHS20C14_20260 [Phycisphaeraceae bacterium]|nr:MAG: hypothetical protein DHS20C14_20260 [Phycisphaeraceae bacterium]
MRGWAGFDQSRRYRYTLGRRWAPAGRSVCFCLLNPSTADASVLDPTLTRCLGFARRWGFHAMTVVNIFALRSTDPGGLYDADDPVGPRNDAAIRRSAARADLVVVGWGNHGDLHARGAEITSILADLCDPMCWAITKPGHPKHPLYLKSTQELQPFGVYMPGSVNA